MNIIAEPYEEVLNRQFGIVLVLYVVIQFIAEYDNVFLFSSVFSAFLFITALYPLYDLCRKTGITYLIFLVFLPLAIFQEYFEYIIHGITEGYFYPISIWWFWVAYHWYTSQTKSWLIALFFMSILLVSFRVQAVLFVSAFAISLILTTDLRNAIKFTLLCIAAFLTYYFFAYLITADLYTDAARQSAELRALNAITDFELADISRLSPVFSMFFFNYGAAGPLNQLLSPFVIYPVWILTLTAPLYYLYKGKNVPFIVLFCTILIIIVLISFFAVNWWRINLRYIYFTLPFFFIIYAWITSIWHNNNKLLYYASLAVFTVFILFNARIYYIYNLAHSYTGIEKRVEASDRYHFQNQILDKYDPDRIFTNRTPVRHSRYLYFLTGKSSESFTELSPDNLNEEHTYWVYLPDSQSDRITPFSDYLNSEYHFNNGRTLFVLKVE